MIATPIVLRMHAMEGPYRTPTPGSARERARQPRLDWGSVGISLAGFLAFLPPWASVLAGGALTFQGSIGVCGSATSLWFLYTELARRRRRPRSNTHE
ncbi:MAG: hypothetical protein IT378_01810 [Sandaracinaceae bacterium]|nr:hypothetical protein [Sandaracinaceae bacterium]